MTDKIVIDRAVVEQALEALNEADLLMEHRQNIELRRSALVALRAALEQSQDHFPDAGNRVPTGWKLVPVEPTKDMKAAGAFAAMDQVRRSYNPPSAYIPVDSMALLSYRAMIAAAPQPPALEQSQPKREPIPNVMMDLGWELHGSNDPYQSWCMAVEWTERAHGIGGEA